jgi:hypothetical protein
MRSNVESHGTSAILSVLRDYHAAMVSGSTDILDKLVAPDFSLVHITGYVQPKEEWFSVIRSGDFDYHQIDIDQKRLDIVIDDASATVTGRGIFNATINGLSNPWRLQFAIRLARSNDRWILADARYSSF